MTIERRLIVGLGDITAVVFECVHCGVRVAINPDDLGTLAGKCPRCSYTWGLVEPVSNVPPTNLSRSFISDFTQALMKIRRLDPQTVGFRLLLEFKEPE